MMLFTILVILIIINRKKPNAVTEITGISVKHELNVNKYYVYSVGTDTSLHSTLGSANPIQFENVDEDGKVFKMTIDGYDIGYIGDTGLIVTELTEPYNFLPVNFKLNAVGDKYIITSVPDGKYLYYDIIVGMFYLIDPEIIDSIDMYKYIKVRLEKA